MIYDKTELELLSNCGLCLGLIIEKPPRVGASRVLKVRLLPHKYKRHHYSSILCLINSTQNYLVVLEMFLMEKSSQDVVYNTGA
jgi:hypothetical protein